MRNAGYNCLLNVFRGIMNVFVLSRKLLCIMDLPVAVFQTGEFALSSAFC